MMEKSTAPPLDRLAAVVSRVQSAVSELQTLAYELMTGRPIDPVPQEEYLSLSQLCARIPYKPQTIRNLMVQGELRESEHFLQRQRHGRIVFRWSRMQHWLRDRRAQPTAWRGESNPRPTAKAQRWPLAFEANPAARRQAPA